MQAATIVNPELRAIFDEVREKEKGASCNELKELLEKTRMLRDNIEWSDKPEWNLINHIHARLLDHLKKRCPELWNVYADKWLPKYLREMEEALQWKKIKSVTEK